MERNFVKMHGLGNDFVVFDSRRNGFIPDAALCRRIADRHRGVGCDQIVILAQPQSPEADICLRLFNADGSSVRTCGNGTRCAARLLFEETGQIQGVIQTGAGLLKVWKESDNNIAVDFGAPSFMWEDIPLAREIDTLHVPLSDDLPDACCVSFGNPHAVIFVPEVESVPLATLGPKLETNPLFPDRANIEFVEIRDHAHIRVRVWERGTGVTQACGSGACATLVAAVRRGLTDRRATIHLDGGDLEVEWLAEDNHVIQIGPAVTSFRGTLAGNL